MPRCEEAALAAEAQAGDATAMARLLKQHKRFAMMLARRYRTVALPDEDTEAAAMEGLVDAVRTYRPDRGANLMSWATWQVRASIQRALRESSEHRTANSDYATAKRMLLERARQKCHRGWDDILRDTALIEEVAVATLRGRADGALPPERRRALADRLRAVIRACGPKVYPMALHDACDTLDPDKRAHARIFGTPDDEAERVAMERSRAAACCRIFDAMAADCTPRERGVLDMRMRQNCTLQATAETLGVTRQGVQQIEQRLLRRFRANRARYAAVLAGGDAELLLLIE